MSLRIVYMGTPDFAVAPLKALIKQGCHVVAVVTNPDKPAGRGQQIKESAVKKYAWSENLKILQPHRFRDEHFLHELRSLKADLQIVVAFKILPEQVWNMPKYGTLNLHASLLPQYRGAAPINRVLINGEAQTGVSTFLLQHEIDTGDLIFQEKIEIGENDNAGLLHDKLMNTGAKLLVKTVKSIESGDYPRIPQSSFQLENLKLAPKIFKKDCRIDWTKDLDSIHNLVRGLSPYPVAWAKLVPENENQKTIEVKIYETEKIKEVHNFTTGSLHSNEKNNLKVAVNGGFLSIKKMQQAGKKQMDAGDFLRGFQRITSYHFA